MTADGGPSYGRERLVEVYTQGMLAGQPPEIPARFERLEQKAREALDPEVWEFAAGSAGGERTAAANRSAFERWNLVPRMLRNVETRSLEVNILGESWAAPIALAPIGIQSIYHEEGELASARAAADLGLPFVTSTVASYSLEEIAEATGDAPSWFQLYWSSDRNIAASLIERAEAAGYDALVITVDTPIVGWRERDVDQAYFPFLDGDGLANYFTDPAFRKLLSKPPEENEDAAIMTFLDIYGDASLTWEDLAWARDQTDLPIVVKGLIHPADAELAIDHGADAVVVSNHGGRQVDNAVPAIEALRPVVDRVDDRVPVLFDSGIRRGADAIMALALGADAVQIGRPYIYGLAIEGEDGVRTVCRNMLADVDLTLGLTGNTDVTELDRSVLVAADDPSFE